MGASHCWTDWISLTLLNWLDFTVSEDKQSKLLRDNVRHIVPISARQKLLARNWQQYFGVWIPNLFPSYWSLSTCFHNLPSLFPGSAECIWVSPLRFNCNFPSSTRHVWADHSLILNMCLLHQRDRFWQIKKSLLWSETASDRCSSRWYRAAGEVVSRYRTIGRALLGRRRLPGRNRTVAARGPRSVQWCFDTLNFSTLWERM